MPTYAIKFTVRGSGPFPYDMLRYDHCYPSTPEDVSWLEELGDLPYQPRELMLTAICNYAKWMPTDQRWESFGWTVTEVYKPIKL